MLHAEVGDLGLQAAATGQRLTGQVLTADPERLAALLLELARLCLDLVDLKLHALARGGDVRHAPAHLLQQLQLALI